MVAFDLSAALPINTLQFKSFSFVMPWHWQPNPDGMKGLMDQIEVFASQLVTADGITVNTAHVRASARERASWRLRRHLLCSSLRRIPISRHAEKKGGSAPGTSGVAGLFFFWGWSFSGLRSPMSGNFVSFPLPPFDAFHHLPGAQAYWLWWVWHPFACARPRSSPKPP